jgi:hypothetical protein
MNSIKKNTMRELCIPCTIRFEIQYCIKLFDMPCFGSIIVMTVCVDFVVCILKTARADYSTSVIDRM